MTAPIEPLARWRLVLGEPAATACGNPGNADLAGMDAALAWLYGRDEGAQQRHQRERQGGSGDSVLSVPDWINAVHRLFPKETIERLERDAVERYKIEEIVTRRDVLERLEPNQALLEAVLRTKHLMNPDVLALARQLVADVVRKLMEALAQELRQAFAGVRDRRRRTRLASARNFDAAATLRANLKHYDPTTRKLALHQPLFNARTKRHIEQWELTLLVDQSGSMVGSVIHSAITASCLHRLPGIRSRLVLFDTAIVDVTDRVEDPVETLMQVQLGGGTDIAMAVEYAAGLIEVPRRSIVIIVSDFFEGGSPSRLLRAVAGLVAQGTRVLGLAALDETAEPVYDRELAARMVELGSEVGAMTPGHLASWIAEKLKR